MSVVVHARLAVAYRNEMGASSGSSAYRTTMQSIDAHTGRSASRGQLCALLALTRSNSNGADGVFAIEGTAVHGEAWWWQSL